MNAELRKICDMCGIIADEYNPEKAEELFEKASELKEKEKWSKIEKLIKKSLEYNPYEHRSWTLYSMCLNNLYREDADKFEMVDSVFNFVMGGINFEAMGEIADSLEEYKILEEKALTYLETAKWIEAEKAFRELLDFDKKIIGVKYPVYLNALGVALKNQKKYAEAEKLYRQAIEENPKDFNGWYILGILLHDCQRYEEAETVLTKALKLDSTHSKAWLFLGNSIANQQRVAEAEKPFRNAVKYDPSDPEAQRFLKQCLEFLGK